MIPLLTKKQVLTWVTTIGISSCEDCTTVDEVRKGTAICDIILHLFKIPNKTHLVKRNISNISLDFKTRSLENL